MSEISSAHAHAETVDVSARSAAVADVTQVGVDAASTIRLRPVDKSRDARQTIYHQQYTGRAASFGAQAQWLDRSVNREDMSTFGYDMLVGVLAALAASVAAVAWRHKLRQWFHNLKYVLLRNRYRIHLSQRLGSECVRDAISAADRIDILTSRGNEFQRATLAPLYSGDRSIGNQRRVRIVLPDTKTECGSRYVRDREREAASHDPAFVEGRLAAQVDLNVNYLRAKVNQMIALRVTPLPHLGRIVITEHVAFATIYSDREHGSDSRMIECRAGSPLYDLLRRLFELWWKAGADVSTVH